MVDNGLIVTSGCLLAPGPLSVQLHPLAGSIEGAVLASASLPPGWQTLGSMANGAAPMAMLPGGGGREAATLCAALVVGGGTSAAGAATGALLLRLRDGVATGSDVWCAVLGFSTLAARIRHTLSVFALPP